MRFDTEKLAGVDQIEVSEYIKISDRSSVVLVRFYKVQKYDDLTKELKLVGERVDGGGWMEGPK